MHKCSGIRQQQLLPPLLVDICTVQHPAVLRWTGKQRSLLAGLVSSAQSCFKSSASAENMPGPKLCRSSRPPDMAMLRKKCSLMWAR